MKVVDSSIRTGGSRVRNRGESRLREVVFLALGFGLVLGATPSRAPAQVCVGGLSECGQWAGPYDLASYLHPDEDEFAHFAVIGSGPNAGKVLPWCINPTVLPNGPQVVYLWDPARPRNPELNFTVDSNIFCGGHTWTSDGTLLWVGGTDVPASLAAGGPIGVKKCRRLDPTTLTVSQIGDITHPYWYESAISLADGRVLMTGTVDVPILTLVEEQVRQFFSLASGWSTIEDNGFLADPVVGYERLHVLPSGRVLKSGQLAQARILDPAVAGTGAWTTSTGLLMTTDRIWGASVYLSYLDATGARVERVIAIGGQVTAGGVTTALSSIEILDNPDAPGAAWQTNPAWNMTYARSRLTAVILPNRRVLVIGGGGYTPPPTLPQQSIPRHTPELLDPVALTWQLMANQSEDRLYHSGGGLLRDGRAFSAGGQGTGATPSTPNSIEIFSPTYAFAAGAPKITSSPSTIGYTGTFTVGVTTFGSPISRVVLIRPGSTTHHFDYDQRYVELTFTTSGSTLTVDAPPSAGTAPPGAYMLFVVSAAGVPSEAQWVRVN